jgi:hypothetical protein
MFWALWLLNISSENRFPPLQKKKDAFEKENKDKNENKLRSRFEKKGEVFKGINCTKLWA